MTLDAEVSVHGAHRPDGLLQAAAEQIAELFGVHRQLDKLLHESASQVGGVEFESIFNPIPTERLSARPRPDAINHDQAFLRSSPLCAADTQTALGLLEVLHGEFATSNAEVFCAFAEREKFFERLADGQSFIFVGSHLEFQDVGFNLEAGSGSRDAKDEHGFVVMEPFAAGTREDLYRATQAGASIYPVFGDYGNRHEPSVVEIGAEIRHLSSPQHAHAIGEIIASLGNRARGAAATEHPDVARFRAPIRYGSYDTPKD